MLRWIDAAIFIGAQAVSLFNTVLLLWLGLTVLLWQASTGVFLLSLVQQYLPQQLEANAAFPGYALAIYAAARFLLQAPAWLGARR